VAIENGKYFPTLELAFKISKVFKTSLEEVFTFEDGSPIQQEKPEKN